jgi:thiol-disulfide isomerase/thioredoxin
MKAAHQALLLLSLSLGLWACDEGKAQSVTVTRERSQAVLGAGPVATTTAVTTVANTAVTAMPKTPRKLCGGVLTDKGFELSTDKMARRSADGERELPTLLDTHAKFTWINFWAAWCVPCKEEIPLLIEWEKKLKAAGVDFKLVFVSLDDDERQLNSFLNQQPATGLRRTYWLTEGSMRSDWLAKVGMKADSELPAHLLVDDSGKVRCKVQGAIESSDYPQLLGLLNGAR